MSAASVVAIIHHLYIVYAIRHKVAQRLIVGFGRKLIGALFYVEAIVEARNEVQRALAFCFLVQVSVGYVVQGGGVAYLFIERSLIVKTCGQAQRHISAEGGHDAQR